GRAGDIDLGQIVADHIQADEQQTPAAQLRPHFSGDPAVALGQRTGFAPAAGGEVAPGFPGLRNPRQTVGDRLAVDHQDALVAIPDFRQVTLGHDLLLTVQGQGLDDHADIGVVRAYAEDL